MTPTLCHYGEEKTIEAVKKNISGWQEFMEREEKMTRNR